MSTTLPSLPDSYLLTTAVESTALVHTSARSWACHWGNWGCQQGMPSTPFQVDSEGVPKIWKILNSCPICTRLRLRNGVIQFFICSCRIGKLLSVWDRSREALQEDSGHTLPLAASLGLWSQSAVTAKGTALWAKEWHNMRKLGDGTSESPMKRGWPLMSSAMMQPKLHMSTGVW